MDVLKTTNESMERLDVTLVSQRNYCVTSCETKDMLCYFEFVWKNHIKTQLNQTVVSIVFEVQRAPLWNKQRSMTTDMLYFVSPRWFTFFMWYLGIESVAVASNTSGSLKRGCIKCDWCLIGNAIALPLYRTQVTQWFEYSERIRTIHNRNRALNSQTINASWQLSHIIFALERNGRKGDKTRELL